MTKVSEYSSRYIVTGGAGFIGSALIRYLMERKDCMVLNIDKLTYASNLESLKRFEGDERYQFQQADIVDSKAMNEIFRRFNPTGIFHLAAESHVDRSIDGPADFIQSNIIGTYSLLEACRSYLEKLDVPQFKFVHVSTDEVYGDIGPQGSSSKEQDTIHPSSPYSASKAASDHLIQAWGRTFKIPFNITHCSNNYGPWQYEEKLIPLFIKNALTGKRLPVYGDGLQIRDWLYVEDHVEALYRVMTNAKSGESYNIGGINERTNIEIVKLLCKYLGELDNKYDCAVADYMSLIEHVKDRAGHDRRYSINCEKIKRELGWMPTNNFETAFFETVEWYYKRFKLTQ